VSPFLWIDTAHPLAEDTPDHQHPRGTMNDSSTEPEFNRRLLQLFDPKPRLRLLDLGCAGGGLVGSLIDDGVFAVGVEGSDYSKTRGRAEWDRCGASLFTADVTEPFQLRLVGEPLRFDVVTAWEFLEHIAEDKLPAVAANIRAHLKPGGLFIGSIATCGDYYDGVEYHATQRPATWWTAWLASEGFIADADLTAYFAPHWVRGPNKGEVSSLCLVCRWSP
jgi:cyclopropane fatty-acyl-phospholipid synthase-like methyltransferase